MNGGFGIGERWRNEAPKTAAVGNLIWLINYDIFLNQYVSSEANMLSKFTDIYLLVLLIFIKIFSDKSWYIVKFGYAYILLKFNYIYWSL